MERVVQEQYDKAVRSWRTADHLLTKTYPFIQEPKLLLTVIENLFLAMSNAMAAMLKHEYAQKRIPAFGETFDEKMRVMRLHVAQRLQIPGEELSIAQELKNIVLAHKQSPVEFVRNNVFVICGKNYELQPLAETQVKIYHRRAKVFIDRIGTLIPRYSKGQS